MILNWTEVNPLMALMGGVLIGGAVSILILFNGKVAGISGIVGGLINPQKNDVAWRIAFVAGLVISPIVYSVFHTLPVATIDASNTMIIIAGLTVGIGTRYGSGCTSGHGVCGLARLTPRSLVASFSFMLAGVATVYLVRQFAQ